MKLKELELYNIGPYRGKNSFNFSTSDEQNTILIGGRNGSGKTTILSSVRLGLYGSLAYGFRTNTNTYLNYVSNILNNDTDQNDYYSIKLSFYLSKQFDLELYTINRSWRYVNNQIKESVLVLNNGIALTATESDNFFELLRSRFAPSLMKLCFFDGEEILNITNKNLLSTYLKELSYNLFDIDLYSSLESSIIEYLYTTVDSKKITQIKKEVDELHNKINEKNNRIDLLTSSLSEYKELLDELISENNDLENEFITHGGLYYEQQKEIEKEIYELEFSRKNNLEDIKEFIGSQMPFFLVHNLYKQLVNQLNKENEYYISKELSNKLSKLSIKNVLNDMNISIDHIEEKKLLQQITQLLVSTEEINAIHNLSITESAKIDRLNNLLTKHNLQAINEKLKNTREALLKIRKLKNKLRNHEENLEFQKILDKRNKNNKKIKTLELRIQDINKEINIVNQNIDELTHRLKNRESKLSAAIRQEGSLSEAEKAITVIKKFKKNQLRNKVLDVEHLTLFMLNKLLRKKNFISSVKINSTTFEINLYDQKQNIINNNLSAGETQILALCLFWATIKAANKQIPIILDTLLGRLDSIHSKSVINKLIPEFGDQVIILATDTEINKELYDDLNVHVSWEYTLEYQIEERKTEINNNFFELSKGVN